MNSAPKISVLTPIYITHESDLRAMIDSILNQTYTDFEFLILNDSPDNKKLKEIVAVLPEKLILPRDFHPVTSTAFSIDGTNDCEFIGIEPSIMYTTI